MPEGVLRRMADTLRHDVGPVVEGSYPRTQAFMAAVILEKLAGQVSAEAADRAADQADRAALAEDLRREVRPDDPEALQRALAPAGDALDLTQVIRALYDGHDALGEPRFAALLGRVRLTLRARLDRQLAYSR